MFQKVEKDGVTLVKGQAMVKENCEEQYLHVQIPGDKMNREYGFVLDLDLPGDFEREEFDEKGTLPSLAGTGRLYCPVLVSVSKSVVSILSEEGETIATRDLLAGLRPFLNLFQ